MRKQSYVDRGTPRRYFVMQRGSQHFCVGGIDNSGNARNCCKLERFLNVLDHQKGRSSRSKMIGMMVVVPANDERPLRTVE